MVSAAGVSPRVGINKGLFYNTFAIATLGVVGLQVLGLEPQS